jgi:hypothetical protein
MKMNSVYDKSDHRQKDDRDALAERAAAVLLYQLQTDVKINGVIGRAATINDEGIAIALIRGAFRGIINGERNASK